MRKYYVGITRAKNRLFIHTNGDCFNRLSTDRYFVDQRQYDMPEEIVLQLSHKDVYRKHPIKYTIKKGCISFQVKQPSMVVSPSFFIPFFPFVWQHL